MLLTKGLIRVGIGIPDNAEFELIGVDDPYHFASAGELSLFRRPLPSTNLKFLSTVMWDGRETFAEKTIHFDLSHQANGATQGHAQAPNPLTDAQQERIVNFETGLFTAQLYDHKAKSLIGGGANGGPESLSSQHFYLGIMIFSGIASHTSLLIRSFLTFSTDGWDCAAVVLTMHGPLWHEAKNYSIPSYLESVRSPVSTTSHRSAAH